MGITANGGAVEAVVWVDGVETPYRRQGHGPPVLLLSRTETGAGDQLAGLSGEFRVVWPGRLPAEQADAAAWSGWLRGLIDGLGLERPVLLAEGDLVPVLEQCRTSDPDRIRGVAVAAPGAAGAWLSAVREAFRDD